jgi:hypothetical protein
LGSRGYCSLPKKGIKLSLSFKGNWQLSHPKPTFLYNNHGTCF